MTDFLLVHGAGQGSWAWSKVWGRMTAPEEHPPTLHKPRRANRVHPIDLPGHGPDAQGDTAAVRLEECIEAIAYEVEHEGLRDLVLVGHGISAGIVLRAAAELPTPPKRLVMVGGIVPERQRTFMSTCSGRVRAGYRLLSMLSSISGRELRFPHPFVNSFLCNSMETMDIVRILGFFGPLPTRLLNSRLGLEGELPAPVSSIVLTNDRLVSAQAQRRTAERLNCEDIAEIDACHMGAWERPGELAEALLKYA